MNNNTSEIYLASNKVFFFFLLLFIVVFLGWFLITPWIFENRVSFILMALFGCCLSLFYLTRKNKWLNKAIFLSTCLFLVVNCLWSFFFLPQINDVSICNGAVYFISDFRPLTDRQWLEYQYTKWDSLSAFETHFFTYRYGPYKIVCDKEQRETNFIRKLYPVDILVFTDSEKSIRYDEWAGATVNSNHYFLSSQCNNWTPSTCESTTYQLIKCNLDYKSCNPLPIQLTEKYDNFYYLEGSKDEISLFDADDKKIFTYGEYPRCYVEGCKILQENNNP